LRFNPYNAVKILAHYIIYDDTIMPDKKKETRKQKQAYREQQYGTYYGNGLWGPDKAKYKENLYSDKNPAWMSLLVLCCARI